MRMNARLFRVLLAVIALVGFCCWGCGDDPVEPTAPPRITLFSAQPPDIMPGDSSRLSYQVSGADSVRLFPDAIRLSPATSGEHYVKPPVPTTYGLVAYNEGGKDSASLTITMLGAMPSIELFDVQPDTILIGDSLDLIWKTVRADSIVIDNSIGKPAEADSGAVRLYPSATTTYTAVARNSIGADTASVTARVEVPFAVEAVHGWHYQGEMGGGIVMPEFRFRVLDADAHTLRMPLVHFSIVEGDGSLAIDSARPDAGGVILNDYIFDGQLGYGLVRALVKDIDTTEVKVRASVIRLGADGQGQYIRFQDTYADVTALNGQPASHDVDQYVWRNYANYENALGVVVAITDVNQNEQIEENEPVDKVIVNTVFSPTTLEGIGIGSTIHEARDMYGSADYHFIDTVSPRSEAFVYESLGAIFYALASPTDADSAVIEIHLWEPVATGAPGLIGAVKPDAVTPAVAAAQFRRFRR